MTRLLVALAVVAAVVVHARPAHACAGCSNPNLPAGRGSAAGLGAGDVSAMINVTATTLNVVHSEHCPEIGPICEQRPEPPQLHDLDFHVGEVRPVFEVGFTDTFGAELQLPFRVTRTTVVFRRLTGEAFTPDYDNIHHRNETLAGISDPWLSGRGSWFLGRLRLVAKVGLTIPLGRTEADPFAAGEAGEEHQHIQFGSGTFNPLLSVDVTHPAGRFELRGYAQALFFLYDNQHGYRAGNRYLGGLAGETVVASKVRLGVGVDVLNEQPERWGGEIQQDGNVGRTDLLVGGTVGYQMGNLTASLSVKAPVWQRFIEAGHTHDDEPSQLTYPAIVNLALQTRFTAF